MTEGMLLLITGWNTKVRSLSDGKLVHGMCEWRQSDGLSILGSAEKAKCRRRCIAGVSDRIKLIRERGRQRHRDRGRFEWFKNTNQITENSQWVFTSSVISFQIFPANLTPVSKLVPQGSLPLKDTAGTWSPLCMEPPARLCLWSSGTQHGCFASCISNMPLSSDSCLLRHLHRSQL